MDIVIREANIKDEEKIFNLVKQLGVHLYFIQPLDMKNPPHFLENYYKKLNN